MVKVVLVDDEERIRMGLAKLIAQVGPEYEVTGLYASGPELLADLDAIEADLLITDIKMPNMNGLDLLDKLSALKPAWKLAVLSGFDDFAYARQALRLGVEDYLLKPVDTGELAQLLRKVKQQLETKQEPIRQEDHIRLLMFSEPDTVPAPLREEAERELSRSPVFKEYYAVFAVHGILENLLEEVKAAASALHRDCIAEPRDTNLAVLIVSIREGDHANTVGEMGQTLLRRLPPAFRGRVGAGEVFRGAGWLREAYRQAATAVQHAWYTDGKSLFESHAQLPRKPEAQASPHPIVLLNRDFREALEMHDFERAMANLRQWLDDLKRRRPSWAELRTGCETVMAMIRGDKADAGEGETRQTHPETESFSAEPLRYADRDAFTSAFLSAVEAAFRSLQEDKQENRVVETVKAYIHQHYTEELELSRLADVVYLTPSYLSKLFKTETGETITDFLISVRMERAKALLRDKHALKTYEVGEKVGYADPAYFNKVFKKVVGCTPKEFRERVRH
ncbi:response regulator [Cohnella candidum]|uniref:Response regulator n=1 Tax=Cohnella candidum TaxID=2674991 RepID=A0A3G3JXX9_9BACL|nr:response regulator [Cohnella candidum]AYQ73094.1 response regulator [Cohnella candidum]